ncbi:hypothetical protein BN2497_6671 [Janthinobacterium sp. CG23_2]|nr:hypothetical protein BN2497_6671 [Janthinobacterium sp. CG23_2]CUU29733.1 hypothetical protein BN3177_6671 [Janthinobacterium sp. CG23_2]
MEPVVGLNAAASAVFATTRDTVIPAQAGIQFCSVAVG